MARYIILGSYNGQDSLGDECLLKCVMNRVLPHDADARFDIHLHGRWSGFAKSQLNGERHNVMPGIQTVFWSLRGRLERLLLPKPLATLIAWLVFPLVLLVAAVFGLAQVREVLASHMRAKAIFMYGGTQFSGQWFWLNAPYYFVSSLFVKVTGGKVFLCQQQFGPLTPLQSRLMRVFIAVLVNDWRTRNELDVALLSPSNETSREIYDEVFSNLSLYPDLTPNEPSHILVNLRLTTFDTDSAMDRARFEAFGKLIDAVQREYDLPVVFFAVSDATFSDDAATFEALTAQAQNPNAYSSVGRVRDEFHLFDLARSARCTISMSFHGCILSGIAGAPFIPVTEGKYYDHKYAGFAKYTGAQQTPLIALSDCNVARDLNLITGYVEAYDRARTVATRQIADAQSRTFYEGALDGR